MLRLAVPLLILGMTFPALASGWEPREGKELIGKPAPELEGLEWLQGGPLTLAGLRGHPVLIRFWTSDCDLCRATAPALNELWNRYRDAGLVVIGIHHPKSRAARHLDYVRRHAEELGFQFPVAQDVDWKTVKAFGVGTVFQSFTSVSILIDRDGIIRFVHDGGEFHAGGGFRHRECNAAYEAVEDAVRKTLKG